MYIWKSIFVFIYEIHMLRPTLLSLYICKVPRPTLLPLHTVDPIHLPRPTLSSLRTSVPTHLSRPTHLYLHICPTLHFCLHTFAPPRGCQQTNFVELWSVSRSRFGRDGPRDMGDMSTGRAASRGALALEPPRATRNTPEMYGICLNKHKFWNFFESRPVHGLAELRKIKSRLNSKVKNVSSAG